jgi:Brp/Blh family beta-carotene 15,15'-monooxygenase
MSNKSFPWGNAAGERNRLLLFAGSALCAVCGYQLHPASRLWVPVALAAVALAVWHGAYDGVLAEQALQPRFPFRWRLPFYVSYLLLTAAVLVLWWLEPVAALVGFLLYSSFHFGIEAEHRRTGPARVGAFATGAIPIVAACCWWPREVTDIFISMLRGSSASAAMVQKVSAGFLLPTVVVAALGAYSQRRMCGARVGLIASELLLFRLCPPVVAFAVFFCLWHTPEHLVETSRDRMNRFSARLALSNLRRGLGPWLLSLAAVVTAVFWGRHTITCNTGLVFIALSALTVPHMVLALLLPAVQRQAILVRRDAVLLEVRP